MAVSCTRLTSMLMSVRTIFTFMEFRYSPFLIACGAFFSFHNLIVSRFSILHRVSISDSPLRNMFFIITTPLIGIILVALFTLSTVYILATASINAELVNFLLLTTLCTYLCVWYFIFPRFYALSIVTTSSSVMGQCTLLAPTIKSIFFALAHIKLFEFLFLITFLAYFSIYWNQCIHIYPHKQKRTPCLASLLRTCGTQECVGVYYNIFVPQS